MSIYNVYTVFDDIGRARWHLQSDSDPIVEQGWKYAVGQYEYDTHYWNGAPTLRPVMGTTIDTLSVVANSANFCTISGIVQGAEVFVNNELQGIVNDGNAELTFDTPGVYTVELILFPYVNDGYVVNALQP